MGSTEKWLWRRDGRVYLHTENDDWAMARHGLEAEDRELTEDEARRSYPGLWERMTRSEQYGSPPSDKTPGSYQAG